MTLRDGMAALSCVSSLLALSPNNKIPALHHREASVTLMESGAILIYLADQTGQLWGDARYETLQWLMLQMGGVGPMLGQVHHFLVDSSCC